MDKTISFLRFAKRFVVIALILFSFFLLGYLFHSIWNARNYSGLWLSGNLTEQRALNIAHSYELTGNWICINIKGMDYERIVEVCKHEAGHSLFATACQRDDEICKQVQEILKNKK